MAHNDIAGRFLQVQFTPLPVNGEPHPTTLGLQQSDLSDPWASGAYLLGDWIAADRGIADAVQRNGKPDAVELLSSRSLAMFYKSPSKTRVYEDSSEWVGALALETDEVPRSVRRLGFYEGPLPPPWPTTLQNRYLMGGVPPTPSDPPVQIGTEGSRYAEYAEKERAKYAESGNHQATGRAASAFARITPLAQVTGIKWQLRVFSSSEVSAFSEPDGSIFVSDTLVQQLNDAELVAILAHEMGHVRYGHDLDFWKIASPQEQTISQATSGWLAGNIIAGGLIGVCIDAATGGMYRLTPESISATLVKAGPPASPEAINQSPPASGPAAGPPVPSTPTVSATTSGPQASSAAAAQVPVAAEAATHP